MAFKDPLRAKANRAYHNMLNRCCNPSYPDYARYGARGIKVCESWIGPGGWHNFLTDVGLPTNELTLDRINPFGNYEPGNVRWTDIVTQRANTRIAAACKRGHVRTEENTRWYIRKNGQRVRQCRVCLRLSSNNYYYRQKEKQRKV